MDLNTLMNNLSRYAAQTDDGVTDPATFLVDAFTDLRLYADSQKVDVYNALDTSYSHYLAEKDVAAAS